MTAEAKQLRKRQALGALERALLTKSRTGVLEEPLERLS
jgi:hypothetical protein